MAKKSKTTKTLVSKKKEEKVVVATPVVAADTSTAEEKKEEEQPQKSAQSDQPKEEPKEEPKKPEAPKPNKGTGKSEKTQKNNEDIIDAEVVDPADDPKNNEKSVPCIGSSLLQMHNGDRISHNHAIDLMKMIHTEYLSDPSAPKEQTKAMRKQFDVMALTELMYYNAQVESDMQQLGIQVTKDQFVEIERAAREVLGITLKGLPLKENPNQLLLNFSESVPEDQKQVAKADVEAAKLEVPEPNPKMSDKQKEEAIRTIFSKLKCGIGGNLIKGLDWAKKAYSMEDESYPVVLAKVLTNDLRTTLTNSYSGMIKGKLNTDHSVLGAHAMLRKWVPSLPDNEIANILKVFLSYKCDVVIKDWNEKTGDRPTIDKELELVNREFLNGCTEKVIDAIVNKKDKVVTELDKGLGKLVVDTDNIRKNFVMAYGDSDDIITEKVKEIAKYYVKPIMRLSAYVDKSAYNA